MLEHYHRLNATISDLIMGNTYTFRVFSENKCGISEESTASKEEAKILKTGITFSKNHIFTASGPSSADSLLELLSKYLQISIGG